MSVLVKSLGLLCFCVVFSICRADVILEVEVEEAPVKIWLSGQNQREDVKNPLLGNEVSVITLITEDIQRQVDFALKAYDEKKIYVSNPPPVKWDSEENRTRIKANFQKKRIAGIEAQGYEMMLRNGHDGVLWVAPANEELAKLGNEVLNFEIALMKKLYGSDPVLHPVDSKEALVMFVTFISEKMGNELNTIRGLPQGIPLLLEERDPRTKQMHALFEVKSLKNMAVDAPIFSAHQGLARVGNLMEMQIKGMQGD